MRSRQSLTSTMKIFKSQFEGRSFAKNSSTDSKTPKKEGKSEAAANKLQQKKPRSPQPLI